MASAFWDKLRGARKIEIFAAVVVVALLIMQWINSTSLTSVPSSKTDLEVRLERILSRIDDAGQVSVMITQKEDGTITGILIVADGLKSIGTYLKLQNAVKTLLDVDLSQIKIIGY